MGWENPGSNGVLSAAYENSDAYCGATWRPHPI